MIGVRLYGGLGNQLFQNAAAIAHAKRVGDDYAMPPKVTNPHKANQLAYSFTCVSKLAYKFSGVDNPEADEYPAGMIDYKEPYFHFCPIPEKKDIILDGYWQTSKYFDEYKDDIIEMFGMTVEKILQGWCAVHVRRGDYLRFPNHHPVQKALYYLEGMDFISRMTNIKNFMVFSDDIPWCKDNFNFPRFEFAFRDGYDEVDDLMAMSSCPHQIISNSSYSWWAQYINPNPDKIVVAPKKERWFGGDLALHDVKDLYDNKWVLL